MLDNTMAISPINASRARNRDRADIETYDEYFRVVSQLDSKTRVIECRDRIQWIVQRAKAVNGQRQWRGMSFCRTKEALLRCVRDWVTGEYQELQALPERLS
jgi:hypothetical protein